VWTERAPRDRLATFTLVVTCLGDPRWSLSSSSPTAETPKLQAPARLHTTAHSSDMTLSPRLHHSTTPRDRPRETETDRLLSLDDLHSLLFTLRSARAFISTAPAPPFFQHARETSRIFPPRGGVAGDIFRPKSGPHFTSTLTPGSNRPSPVPKRRKARKGGGEIPGVLLELLLS